MTQTGHPDSRQLLRTWSPKPALSIGILVIGVTRAGMTPATRLPAACLNACWLMPGARAALACIDGRPGCITMLKTLIIATVLLPTLAIGQRSQQIPQPRQPGKWCPVGWMASGSYCVPGSDKAPAAIPKNGWCPAGWHESASYCIR